MESLKATRHRASVQNVSKASLSEHDKYLIPLISHGGSQLGIQLAQIFCHCPGSLPAFHGFDLQRINELDWVGADISLLEMASSL